jgi:hypothetical protein
MSEESRWPRGQVLTFCKCFTAEDLSLSLPFYDVWSAIKTGLSESWLPARQRQIGAAVRAVNRLSVAFRSQSAHINGLKDAIRFPIGRLP